MAPRRFGLACAAVVAFLVCLPVGAHAASVGLTYVAAHARGVVMPSDFLNYYGAGRTLLEQPSALYTPGLEAALQRTVTERPDLYAQFQNMPQVALMFVAFAWLPYGDAYLVWLALNLTLLGLAVWLLAPRHPRVPAWASSSAWVLLVLVGYAPAQLALVDGQTTVLALAGFCAWIACLERGVLRTTRPATAAGGALWLLTWAAKPTLLPILLLALARSHAIGRALLLVGVQGVALAVVVAWSGPAVLERYVTLTREAAAANRSGQTVFGLAQALDAPGVLTVAVSVLGAALVLAAITYLWWAGLRGDARRLLQLASLPPVAILLAARAYAYELTLWLATAWLVLRFLAEARDDRQRWLLPVWLAVAWAAATFVTLTSESGLPWAAFAGLGLLAAVAWQYHVASSGSAG